MLQYLFNKKEKLMKIPTIKCIICKKHISIGYKVYCFNDNFYCSKNCRKKEPKFNEILS